MIIRTTFFVVASIATLAVSSISARRPSRESNSTIDGDNDSSSHENEGSDEKEKQNAENQEFPDEETEEKKQVGIRKSKRNKQFIGNSENLIEELKQRKIALESRLFELYGMKEEYFYVAHLRKELKAKMAEIDRLILSIDSIRVEKRRLEDDAREVFSVEKQLDAAKKTVQELQEKISFNANRVKGQLELLEGQILCIWNEKRSARCVDDPMFAKNLQDFSRLELEELEMKRKNKELELEKRELVILLSAARARVSNILRTAESEVTGGTAEEVSALRRSTGELSGQVERLQKHRFGMVEELVYQRWLNCCLRFEIHSYQKNRRRNSEMHSLSEETSSQQSRDSSTSSQPSGSDSTFVLSSSGSQGSVSKNTSLIRKARTLNKNRGLIRRFSTSVLPSNIFTKKNDAAKAKKCDPGGFTDSPETPRLPRPRRVSFNDFVRKLEPEFQDIASEQQTEREEPDLDQPDKASGADHNDVFSSDLIDVEHNEAEQAAVNRKQNEAVHAAIPSYLSESTIAEETARTSRGAEDIDARTSDGLLSDQRRYEVHSVKFIPAFTVICLLLLLCIHLSDFRSLRA